MSRLQSWNGSWSSPSTQRSRINIANCRRPMRRPGFSILVHPWEFPSLPSPTSDGNECAPTPGDVVYRTGDKPDDDKMVDATVKSAKKDECPVGATVGIDVSDLQDMHNSLRQTMDEGLKKLAENNGKNGLPAAPDTKTTAGEVPPPAPDSNVQDDLAQTQKDADQAEAEAKQPN